jgi:hypothetical protein
MKMSYCRYCKKIVPMLNDEERQQLRPVFIQCLESIKAYRSEYGVSLSDTPTDELYEPLFALYKQITGVEAEFSAYEIMRRHYLSRWKAYRNEEEAR